MKILVSATLLLIGVILLSSTSYGQVNIIYTAAGNGTAGFSGDGGPATVAELNGPTDVCEDHAGNLYIADHGNNRIRKVDALTNIITTIAGTGVTGYTGDGGPATAAALSNPNGICVDGANNLYIADQGNNVIRKVSAAGIITTIAGTGIAGFSGDGGSALSAQFSTPSCIAVDDMYNLYVGDQGNYRIRKIEASTGIISTIAGNGSSGGWVSSTVPATSVGLCNLHHLSIDASGNIYFTNQGCHQFVKIDPYGLMSEEYHIDVPWGVCNDINGNVYMCAYFGTILRQSILGSIDTIVRGDSSGYWGDGGPALTAGLYEANGIYANVIGNIDIADAGNNRVRIITSTITATYNADSFSVFINKLCGGPQLVVSASRYAASLNQTTYFGDGTSASASILPGYGGSTGYSLFSHTYGLPGTYSLKTILRDGTTVIDSIAYSAEVKMCNIIQSKFYIDVNNSMAYEPDSDILSFTPVLMEVDSNGVAVDTISATSGSYYSANGLPGDIYTLKVISSGGALVATSPSSGILSDTIQAGIYNSYQNMFGLNCSGLPGFDLSIHTTSRVGVHHFGADIYVSNSYCSSSLSPATVTARISPKYGSYYSATPTPSTIVGNKITWNLPFLSATDPPTHITLGMEGGSCIGDTVHALTIISPTTGDADTSDNIIIIVDTVKSGYDPNFMEVSPTGYIPAGTKLQYTIGFENTGNDTAHNIYVLDTLSDNVDPSTLRIVTASAAMNIFTFFYSGHTVVKFDFPAINILDSSHHDQCSGTVVYTVKTRTGLPNCTHILNEAGIYFDENPVVMTNAVENIIGPPPAPPSLSGATNVCIGEAISLTTDITGGTWSVNDTNATISSSGMVTGVATGNAIIYYTVPAACGPVTSMYEVNVGPPSAGAIVSSSAICAGSSIVLSSTATGGTWSVFNANATTTGDTLTALTIGTDTVYYSITTACGSATTAQAITIETNPVVAALTGPALVCIDSSITLTDAVSGGVWSCTPGAIVTAAGVVTGVSPSAVTINYTVSNSCGSVSAADNITVIDCSAIVSNTASGNTAPHIFPNPTNDVLTIVGDKTMYSFCTITNMMGQALITEPIAGAQTQVIVKMLSPGMYYLTLRGANGAATFKFVKE